MLRDIAKLSHDTFESLDYLRRHLVQGLQGLLNRSTTTVRGARNMWNLCTEPERFLRQFVVKRRSNHKTGC